MDLTTLDQRVLALAQAEGLVGGDRVRGILEGAGDGPGVGSSDSTLWSPALQRLVDAGALGAGDLDRLLLQALLQGSPDGESAGGPGTALPSAWVESGLGGDRALDLGDLQLGRLGHYRDLTLIGAGGQGRVYRAFDEHLERWVALKLLPPQRAGAHLEEARTQAKVEHPNICKVFEVGEALRPDGVSQPYIAMQLVEGRTLAHADLPPETVVTLMVEVAEGVHAAHGLGLVHLDLKPGNILLETRPPGGPHPYVTDFGLLASGSVLGTPPYCAPEQVAAGRQAPDRRSDVYGLGATLYVLLSGAFPFQARNLSELLRKIRQDEPEALHRRVPGLPADLSTIVATAMAKEPAQRYGTALALAEDLRRFAEGRPIAARASSTSARLGKWVRRNRFIAAAGSVGAASFLVFGGLALRAARRSQAEQIAAAQLGADANGFRTAMQAAYLAPHHDLRPEIARIRRRMAEIRAAYPDTGAGPAAYALGHGHEALGELEEARKAYARAWEAGYRTPDLMWSYGRVLGFLYRQRSRTADQELDPGKRAQALAQVRDQLLRPALAQLAGGGRLSARDAQLAALLEAEFERRDRDVVRLASGLAPETATDTQALSLQAARLNSVATAQPGPEALKSLAEAKALLLRGLEIGRSSPELHQHLARCLYLQSLMEERSLGALQPGTVAALDEASRRYLALDPDDLGAWLARCDALLVGARLSSLQGGDAGPLLREVLELGGRISQVAEPLDRTRGFELIAAACEESLYLPGTTGAARRDLLLRGIEACRASLRLEPRGSNAAVPLVQFLLARSAEPGLDPGAQRALADEARQRAEEALAQGVSPLTAHQVAGLAWKRQAELARARGDAAEPALRASRDHFEAAWKLAPQDPAARNLYALSLLELAALAVDRRLPPEPFLGDATRILVPLVEAAPAVADFQDSLLQARLLAARWAEASGGSPGAALRAGRAALAAARRRVPPGAAGAFDALEAQFLLLEARAALAKGASPEAGLRQADARLQALAARNPEARLGALRGEAARLRATWLLRRGRPAAELLEAGLAAAGEALRDEPMELDARLLRARLLRLRAGVGARRDGDLRQAWEDLAPCLAGRPRDPEVLALRDELKALRGGPGPK